MITLTGNSALDALTVIFTASVVGLCALVGWTIVENLETRLAAYIGARAARRRFAAVGSLSIPLSNTSESSASSAETVGV